MRPPSGDSRLASRERSPLRVGLFGASLATGNLGVSALGLSALEGLGHAARDDVECLLFDYGRDAPNLEVDGLGVPTQIVPCAYSRRLQRSDNLRMALWAAQTGMTRVHPLLRRMHSLDAVLDLSGGDSFTDLYGSWRFRSVAAPKSLALALGHPLLLLPQTYGPFRSPRARRRARRILTAARLAWAREEDSLDVVRELLGSAFSPIQHRSSVDVAFGLTPRRPSNHVLLECVAAARQQGPALFGLNVSGLLYHDAERARRRFRLAMPYPDFVRHLLQALLQAEKGSVLLIPHVAPPCASVESDVAAGEALRASLPPDLGARVFVVPPSEDPREAKWVIGNCRWFCGTRMHACIAALSQGVPTLGIAYSDKMRGVFRSVAMADQVLDARSLGHEVSDLVRRSLAAREDGQRRLKGALVPVQRRWAEQFTELVSTVRSGGNSADAA